MQLTVEGAATRLEGPLLFLRRTLDVGLQDAVEVRGSDGRPRLGRVAAIDEQFLTIEVLESTVTFGRRAKRTGCPFQFSGEIATGLASRVAVSPRR